MSSEQVRRDTIPSVVAAAADRWPDGFWLGFQDDVVTFGELNRRVETIARGLSAHGIGRGSRVALHMGNRSLWLEIQYAVTSLGAWLVPLNTMLTPSELTNLIEHARVDALIWAGEVVGHDTIGNLREVLGGTSPELLIGVGAGDWPEGVHSWESIVDAAETVEPAFVRAQAASVTGDDVALVIYTSGTTGNPKGVLQTHRSIVTAGRRWAEHLTLGPEDRSIFSGPLYWIHGCWHQAMVPLCAGSGLLLEERFNVATILTRIDRDGCTHLQGIPAQYEMLLAGLATTPADLSRLRIVQIGGTTFSPTLPDRIRAVAPDAQLLGGYGLSEAGSAAYTPLGAPMEDVSTTIGTIHPGGEARIVDAEDLKTELEPGNIGEFLIKTDCTTIGYLDDPAATEKAFVDGWLRTGDLAKMDERGYITIVGRNQDAYKRSGVTIYTIDAETTLASHDDVEGVAVVGVTDETLGQIGIAFVVVHPGAGVTEQDLRDFCAERLARYKVPAEIHLLDQLPSTSTGKIRKYELKRRFEAAALIS
ncbi:class I adenylate-forming enzyme family protein [Rhodococcoides yunnanense]|uniref:class I adenylate-forming enzyme family protein n=1 Tax=Rhodococcoides yunnanense TaxID=278209 RepID=UPI0014733285|nr:class I adenylate-forming enzyme family protein [Rhodococcus yunnanensis]